MRTTLSRSQTLALWPKCCLKMPMVPGPQTSCVMSTSTSTQMFSPGAVAPRPAARARIFSVIVIGGIGYSCGVFQEHLHYIRSTATAFVYTGPRPSLGIQTSVHIGVAMRAFVTGGTGLVGVRLVRALRKRGDDVIVLSRRADVWESVGPDCTIVHGDPTVPGPWQDRIAEC